MATDSGCPPDDVFLALKDGDDVPADVHVHLVTCSNCQRRFAELAEAIRSLRELESDATLLEGKEATLQRGDSSELATRQDEPDEGPATSTRRDLEPRDYLGRFRLIRVLGKGAFGEVHLAEDPHLDRKVAIKLAPQRVLAKRSGVDRFQREAQAAAQLRHPNIIPVYDVGSVDSINYIVYEFVEGQTLRAVLLFRHKLPQEEAASLLSKLARALDYAHANGVVHRDIKPDNILIDQAGEPHIADFGLAYRDESETLRTREGILMGTPAYMSPEQASGRGHDVDARADIWSLGVLMQEVMTGERPFEGPLNSILTSIQHADPKPIKDASVSKDLAAICQTCLAKSANARYQKAGELADDLDHWSRNEPVSVCPLDPLGRVSLWARRSPTVAALAATVVATLALGLIVASYFAVDASRKATSLQQEQRERALAQIGALRAASPELLPFILTNLKPHREAVLPRLRDLAEDETLTPRERARMRVGVALLGQEPLEHEQLTQLRSDMMLSSGKEFLALRNLLQPYAEQLRGELWVTVLNDDVPSPALFRAECALALYNPAANYWSDISESVAAQLLVGSSADASDWTTALRPVRESLLPFLKNSFAAGDDQEIRFRAAKALSELFDDQPELLVELVLDARSEQLRPLLPSLPAHRASAVRLLSAPLLNDPVTSSASQPVSAVHLANAAVALFYLDRQDLALPLLEAGPENTVRTLAVHRLGPAGIEPASISRAIAKTQNPHIASALILSLGEFRSGLLNRGRRAELVPGLLRMHREHADPGVHSAIDWLLRHWRYESQVDEQSLSQQSRDIREGRRWFVNRQGQVMAVLAGPVTFQMGSAADDPERQPFEESREATIAHTFAISTKEVTNAEFLRFRDDPYSEMVGKYSPDPKCPVIDVSWYDAIKYCRWLSEQEEIPEDQMCFPAIDEIGPNMPASSIRLDRSGYRLPTATEWEYACRAGSDTNWHHGSDEEMLTYYAWYTANSQNRTWPVGQLKPNVFGLFDTHANAHEWCQNVFDRGVEGGVEAALVVNAIVTGTFEVRGGAFLHPPQMTRSAWRDDQPGHIAYHEFGFRVARTYNGKGGAD